VDDERKHLRAKLLLIAGKRAKLVQLHNVSRRRCPFSMVDVAERVIAFRLSVCGPWISSRSTLKQD
jgi:hypothetical protein